MRFFSYVDQLHQAPLENLRQITRKDVPQDHVSTQMDNSSQVVDTSNSHQVLMHIPRIQNSSRVNSSLNDTQKSTFSNVASFQLSVNSGIQSAKQVAHNINAISNYPGSLELKSPNLPGKSSRFLNKSSQLMSKDISSSDTLGSSLDSNRNPIEVNSSTNLEKEILDYDAIKHHNSTSYKTPLSGWLKQLKFYWRDMRRNKGKFVHDFENSEYNGNLSYAPTSSIEYTDNGETESYRINELCTSKLHMKGFTEIAKFLSQSTAIDVFLSTNSLFSSAKQSINNLPSSLDILNSSGNPCYCYTDNPITGWTKQIVVRLSGKTMGLTEVIYVSPNHLDPIGGSRRFRGKVELHAFFVKHGISLSLLSRFNFQGVFCVCHQPEDRNHSYLECSFGFAGCKSSHS